MVWQEVKNSVILIGDTVILAKILWWYVDIVGYIWLYAYIFDIAKIFRWYSDISQNFWWYIDIKTPHGRGGGVKVRNFFRREIRWYFFFGKWHHKFGQFPPTHQKDGKTHWNHFHSLTHDIAHRVWKRDEHVTLLMKKLWKEVLISKVSFDIRKQFVCGRDHESLLLLLSFSSQDWQMEPPA